MRISDWSSDVCSSDLGPLAGSVTSVSYPFGREFSCDFHILREIDLRPFQPFDRHRADLPFHGEHIDSAQIPTLHPLWRAHHLFHLVTENRRAFPPKGKHPRSEEHTSELQSLMRTSYAVFCLKKKNHI